MRHHVLGNPFRATHGAEDPAMARSKLDINADDLAVAMMYLGNSQPKEIAARLKIDITEVSRSLKRTQGRYWKRTAIVAGPELSAVPEKLKGLAAARIEGSAVRPIHASQLMRHAGAQLRHLRSVAVIPARCTLPLETDSKSWFGWMSVFARLASAKVRPLMSSGATWGVTWGSHVSAVVDAIAHETDGVQGRRRAMRVLPLCGNRCGDRLVSESSSAIAERLGIELAGEVALPSALNLVPAFILGDLSEEDTIPLWKQVARSEGYCEIFGVDRIPSPARPPAPRTLAWVEQLDGVLTSVSRDGHPFGYGENRMYENAGYQRDVIERAYLGEIGGVGLARPGEVAMPIVEQRWTGMRAPELLACATRASEANNGVPGVVVVASGAGRATSLIESVRHGYVSHAVIDESLNEELVRRMLGVSHRKKR
jgi:DNA-binding transcriptional regulator LsrR (DeoR family)